jgi:hypothetical protein
MSTRILFMNNSAHRVVDENTTLPEVEEHYADEMGKARARRHNFSIRTVPEHGEL